VAAVAVQTVSARGATAHVPRTGPGRSRPGWPILRAVSGAGRAPVEAVKGGPPFTGDTSLFQFFGYFGLFCATVLILRVIVAILRDGLS
jgi:hypothetical protein